MSEPRNYRGHKLFNKRIIISRLSLRAGVCRRSNLLVLVCFLLLVSCAKNNAQIAKSEPNLSQESEVVSLELIPVLHYPFASDRLSLEASKIVDNNAKWMLENPNAVVVLEGHCDEVGDANYNLLLGDRRARYVKAALMANGVPSERVIMVVSFGENRPIDARHNKNAYRKNRRVAFVLR